jgi:hypothetical protein
MQFVARQAPFISFIAKPACASGGRR